MEDDLGPLGSGQLLERGAVADVGLDQLRAGSKRSVEVLPLAGREVIDDDHLVAAREQGVDQIRADKPRAACHQSLH